MPELGILTPSIVPNGSNKHIPPKIDKSKRISVYLHHVYIANAMIAHNIIAIK